MPGGDSAVVILSSREAQASVTRRAHSIQVKKKKEVISGEENKPSEKLVCAAKRRSGGYWETLHPRSFASWFWRWTWGEAQNK